jgi:hypothetical protein
MDKTNYSLLAIVAIVALTAIVAMYVSTDHDAIEPVGPTIEFTDTAGGEAALTGYVSIERATREYVASDERARAGIALSDFDYDGNGELTIEDSYILDAVVARTRFCPAERVCDVNEDDIVDTVDRRDYYAAILRLQADKAESLERLAPPKLAAPVHDDEFWLATAGGAIQ